VRTLAPEHFLSAEEQRAETLRNVVHLKVCYHGSNKVADIYFLRGELAQQDQTAIRESLRPWETTWRTGPAHPLGLFPYHETLAEGYSWAHVEAYAQYAEASAESAWHCQDSLAEKVALLKDDSYVDLAHQGSGEYVSEEVKTNGTYISEAVNENGTYTTYRDDSGTDLCMVAFSPCVVDRQMPIQPKAQQSVDCGYPGHSRYQAAIVEI